MKSDVYDDLHVRRNIRLPNDAGIYLFREVSGTSVTTEEYRNSAGNAASGVFYDCDYIDDGPYQGEYDDIHKYFRYKYTLANGIITKTDKVGYWYEISPEYSKG